MRIINKNVLSAFIGFSLLLSPFMANAGDSDLTITNNTKSDLNLKYDSPYLPPPIGTVPAHSSKALDFSNRIIACFKLPKCVAKIYDSTSKDAMQIANVTVTADRGAGVTIKSIELFSSQYSISSSAGNSLSVNDNK